MAAFTEELSLDVTAGYALDQALDATATSVGHQTTVGFVLGRALSLNPGVSLTSGAAWSVGSQAAAVGALPLLTNSHWSTLMLTRWLHSAYTSGHGVLSFPPILSSGTATGHGTLTDPAIVVRYMRGTLSGHGDLVWCGPTPLSGHGILTGLMEVTRIPCPCYALGLGTCTCQRGWT